MVDGSEMEQQHTVYALVYAYTKSIYMFETLF